MERTNRMSNLFNLTTQRLLEFALVAIVAFILGIAVAQVIPSLVTRATTSPHAAALSISRRNGTGSVYDGQPLTITAGSSTARHSSTGSVYDGQVYQHRSAVETTVHQRAVPATIAYHIGTSSVYDGQPLQHPLDATSRVSTVGTGSVYDGQPVR